MRGQPSVRPLKNRPVAADDRSMDANRNKRQQTQDVKLPGPLGVEASRGKRAPGRDTRPAPPPPPPRTLRPPATARWHKAPPPTWIRRGGGEAVVRYA